MPPAGRADRVRRWLLRGFTAVVVLLLVLLGYSCLRPNARSSYSAPAAALRAAPAGVTYAANGMLYVVAQPDGTFVAVDELDRITANRLNGCVVRWRPDLLGGVFQEDERCGGAVFERDGTARSGGLSLLRHPLRLAGKRVVVDIRQCMAPEQGPQRPCTEFHR